MTYEAMDEGMESLAGQQGMFMEMRVRRPLVVGIALSISVMLCGCGTTERILSTELVMVRKVLVEPSPAGEVYVNGRRVGRSPISVPLYCRRHKIERTTRKAGRDIDDALIVGIPVTVIFPPVGLLVLLVYGQNGGFVKTEKEVFLRDEAMTCTVEVRRPDYVAEWIEIPSDRRLRAWRPNLALTAAARAERERRRQVAEAARRKASEDERLRKEADRLSRVAAKTSAAAGDAMTALNEIVSESVKTRQNLLRKSW